jgi:hypothetical protein
VAVQTFVKKNFQVRKSGSSQKRLARSFEQGDNLLAPDTGKSLDKVVDGLPRFEMIEQTLHRHACTNENWRASQNLGIGMEDFGETRRVHGGQCSRIPGCLTKPFSEAERQTEVLASMKAV